DDSLFDLFGRCGAAIIAGCTPILSIPTGLENNLTHFVESHYGRDFLGSMPVIYQTDDQLTEDMGTLDRIRYGAPDRVPVKVFEVAAQTGFYISRTPVYMEGQLELLQYFQQQSICNNYHRYGNLGERSMD
ncbi:MAG: aldehyde dehydrogenase, partial [Desulfocapsa sp.]|nr:aldehyde dehydrogenase [Desulfocapsa sp.]